MAISNAVSLANFTSGDALTVDSANDRVGIASTQPTSTLTVTGDAIATGVVTATTFVGALTGNATSATTATTATTATNAQGLTGSPDITVGTLSATTVSIAGTLTYEDVTNVDSVGVITARTDINLGDSIIHISDPDTKIRFPSDDTISAETGGSERLRIASSGQVLIGGTSSGGNAILTVQGLSGNTTEQGTFALRRSANNGNNNKIGVIEFAGGDNNQAALIQAVGDNTWGTNDYPGRLEFYTTPDSSATPVERVRINSAGNVTFKNGLVEKAHLGTTLQADNTLALSDGNVVFRSSNETGGSQAVNFTGIHGVISTNDTVSYTVIITPNGSGLINAVQVDGQSISSLYWLGGSAPSASASGRDVYSFTIIKTGSAATDYEIFASMNNFA